jgi:hypothetical protein
VSKVPRRRCDSMQNSWIGLAPLCSLLLSLACPGSVSLAQPEFQRHGRSPAQHFVSHTFDGTPCCARIELLQSHANSGGCRTNAGTFSIGGRLGVKPRLEMPVSGGRTGKELPAQLCSCGHATWLWPGQNPPTALRSCPRLTRKSSHWLYLDQTSTAPV